jgi:G2/mitotic-specific cyclin 3/4
MAVILECCQKQREHHSAVFDKYAQKQYKKASGFVETELMKGFELPAVVRRESSLGVASSCAVSAISSVMPSALLWRPQTSK